MSCCKSCQCQLNVENSYLRATGTFYSYCKQCAKMASQTWKNTNREKTRSIGRKEYKKNRVKRIARKREYNNLNREKYLIKTRMSTAVRRGLKGAKNNSWQKLVGYSIEDLRKHLESKFVNGMTWEEFNKGNIHIDHIIPQIKFSYKTAEDSDFKACWALSNLQPLWKVDNLRKGATLSQIWPIN